MTQTKSSHTIDKKCGNLSLTYTKIIFHNDHFQLLISTQTGVHAKPMIYCVAFIYILIA